MTEKKEYRVVEIENEEIKTILSNHSLNIDLIKEHIKTLKKLQKDKKTTHLGTLKIQERKVTNWKTIINNKEKKIINDRINEIKDIAITNLDQEEIKKILNFIDPKLKKEYGILTNKMIEIILN